MNTDILKKAEKDYLKSDIPTFEVGDTIAVHTIIREKGKERVQIFKGIVISIKGSGTGKTFTIRKVATGGVGVEKILPLHSPNIKKIEFIKKGKVRRSRIFFMRDRIGKQATKITEGEMSAAMKAQHESLEEKEGASNNEGTAEVKTEEEVKTEVSENQEVEAKVEKQSEEKKEETKQEDK